MKFLILIGLLLASGVTQLMFNQPTLQTGTHGVSYSQQLLASGGVQPYKWMQTGLPDGLTLDSATGIISGIPTQTGNYRAGLQVADAEKPAQRVQRNVTLVIE